MRWKLILGILSAALAFCSPGGDSTPSEPALVQTPSERPSATPTLQPEVIIVSASDTEPGVAEVSAIAEEASWRASLRASIPGSFDPGARQTILVDFNQTNAAELAALAARGVGVIAIGRDDLQATEQMTVIDAGAARQDQAGFLAGVLTAFATRTQRVGVIQSAGGAGGGSLSRGFDNGLRYICPRCNVMRLLASEANLNTFRANGVDVIFAFPGDDSITALGELADEGLWTIQIGAEVETAGSVRFTPSVLVGEALRLMIQGEPGKQIALTVSNGGIEIVELDQEVFSPGRLSRILETLEAMKAGLLETGVGE